MTHYLPVYKNEALNIHFEETGYEHSDQILNITAIIVFFIMALIFVALMLVIKCACCCQRVEDFAKRQLDLTFFNRTINFFDAQLLVVTACAWINIYQVNR